MRTWYLLISVASLIFVGLVIASLIAIDIEIQLKIIIAFSIILGVFILQLLIEISDRLTELVIDVRSIVVSIETQRLDPDNKQSALDILAEDIRHEKRLDKFKKELSSFSILKYVFNLITLAILCGAAFLFYIFFKG